MLGIMTNAARHEPDAVAALRAGREDRFNRLLRLPLPEPYVPSRLESARDRLRTRPEKRPPPKPAPPRPSSKKPKPKVKPRVEVADAKGRSRGKPTRVRKPAEDRRRGSAEPVGRTAKGTGHHGDRQRQPSRRARPLEGQRYG